MKCKYCNAEIEQDAQFCPNCGKDLSKFNKCVKCGELLDNDTVFCPHCGTGQPHEVVVDEEKVSAKKWIWAVVGVLLVALIVGGYYYLSQKEGETSRMAEAVDCDSITVVDVTEVTDMESLEKDLSAILSSVISPSFELEEMHKYFTEGYINFYKRACEKADKEGCERPRLWWQESESDPESYKINSIDTKSENEAVAKVTITGEAPEGIMKVVFDVVVKKENGKWLIDSITRLNDEESETISTNTQFSFVNRIYKGSGNGGGIGTKMTISFLDNNKCLCESDWYQAFSSPKTVQGTYSMDGDKLLVRCQVEDTEYEFKFDVKSNGRVIEFNNSDPDVEGTMGNDIMSLELQ